MNLTTQTEDFEAGANARFEDGSVACPLAEAPFDRQPAGLRERPCADAERLIFESLNLHEKTMVNLVKTYNWINASLKKQFNPSGITIQQFHILRILRAQHDKPATINLLKERMLDKMSDASRIVERLVQKGLASRTICAYDRRAVDISITDAGLTLLQSTESTYNAACTIGDRLNNNELEEFNRMLESLRH